MKWKSLAFFLGGAFLAWLAIGVAAPLWVRVDTLPVKIAEVFERKTGLALKIEEAHFSTWLGPRIVFERVQVGEIASIPTVSAKVSIWSWLIGDPRLSVVVDHPTFTLTREIMLKTLHQIEADRAASKETKSENHLALPAAFLHASIDVRVRAASVEYRTSPERIHRFHDLNLVLHRVHEPTMTFEAWSDLSFRSGSQLAVEGPIRVEGQFSRPQGTDSLYQLQVGIDLSQVASFVPELFEKKRGDYSHLGAHLEISPQGVEIDQAVYRLGKSKLEFHGRIEIKEDLVHSVLSQTQAQSDLVLEIPDLKEWSRFFPAFVANRMEGSLLLKGNFQGSILDLRHQGTLQLQDFVFYSNEGDQNLRWEIQSSVQDGRMDAITLKETRSGLSLSGALTRLSPINGKLDVQGGDSVVLPTALAWISHQVYSLETRFGSTNGMILVRGKEQIKTGPWTLTRGIVQGPSTPKSPEVNHDSL